MKKRDDLPGIEKCAVCEYVFGPMGERYGKYGRYVCEGCIGQVIK